MLNLAKKCPEKIIGFHKDRINSDISRKRSKMEVKSTASPRLLNDFILLCIMLLVVIKIELELLALLIIGISVRCTASGFINWHLLVTEYFSKKNALAMTGFIW